MWLSEVVSGEQILVQGMLLSLFKLSQLDEPSLKFSHRYNNNQTDSLATLLFHLMVNSEMTFEMTLFFSVEAESHIPLI